MKRKRYFSKKEAALWTASVVLIFISFLIFDRGNYLNLTASLIGATALIFLAKGNPIGQALTVVFVLFYGYISFTFSYYGEMITCIGMTGSMALLSLISWLRNPYKGNRAEVEVNHLKRRDVVIMIVSAAAVSTLLYFVLKAFNTANLPMSTLSVATSFIASYLTFKRSSYYAVAYAANDVVLICMWIFASMQNLSYISMVVCFIIFLANDTYAYFNWSKMKKRQQKRD